MRIDKPRKTAAQWQKDRYAARRAADLCTVCGIPTVGGFSRCFECSKQRSSKQHTTITCVCGRLRFKRSKMCKECYENNLLQRLQEGLCKCGEPLVTRNGCLICWTSSLVQRYGGTKELVQALVKLLEKQNYKCALTGEDLIVGVNVNLDHIVPVSRGGKHTIDNFQWVTKTANAVKTNLTMEELAAICRKILIHFDKI